MPAATIDTLKEFIGAELAQKETLFALLGASKGSKSNGAKTSIASIVRGLCTNNQKILRLAQQCLEDVQQECEIEPLKNFANEMLLWFDQNFVVFEKFFSYLSNDQLADDTTCEATLLHCKCYIRLIDSIAARLRNPFVVSKLSEAKDRVEKLLLDFHAARNQSDLDNITFDHVRSLNGFNVSCFFTVDQIVLRTGNAVLHMGQRPVELLLLNLDRSSRANPKEFNALAILELMPRGQPRSVVYPPFRVNELSMVLSSDLLSFSAFAADAEQSFAVSGDKKLLKKWFRNLSNIFPTSDVPLTSSTILLDGLGINTPQYVDFSGNSSANELSGNDEPLTSSNSYNSLQIMKKSLLNDGIKPSLKLLLLKVVPPTCGRDSVAAEYDFVKVGESQLTDETVIEVDEPTQSDEANENHKLQQNDQTNQNRTRTSSCDSVDCFDIITTLPESRQKPQRNDITQNQNATMSMPDLSAVQPPSSIYINATGSAIDVSQFGKNYNPTFEVEPKMRRKTLFSLFKKKRALSDKDKVQADEGDVKNAKSHAKTEEVIEKKSLRETLNKHLEPQVARCRPELQIEIPKISAFDANMSQPSSALSTSNRTLPLPFAMPSSASTSFFKPYLSNSSSTLPNSASDETEDGEEISLSIPREFKDMINSERTVDRYISPISLTMLKVSKWKPDSAKWELITVNENVFIKIVSHDSHRNWMLVFKEDYDEKYNEVVDKPLLILEIDEGSKIRQSSALDIEINAVNALTNKSDVIMIRCSTANLAKDISGSLEEVVEPTTQRALTKTSHFESNTTITSSLMSKTSMSSMGSSLNAHLEAKSQEAEDESSKVLLDRMTVRVHKQKESHEDFHTPSSWESMSMYSLSILHSMTRDKGYYHFDLKSKSGADIKAQEIRWTFHDVELFLQLQRIGKAGILVKVSDLEIYMLECKGRKELQQLIDLL